MRQINGASIFQKDAGLIVYHQAHKVTCGNWNDLKDKQSCVEIGAC